MLSQVSDIETIDHEVQTSLKSLDLTSRENIQQELGRLREDKSLLEGKIRGYLTLSDICREYKEELHRLRQEYNKLLSRVNTQSGMELQHHKKESPTPDNGPVRTGHEKEQRTHFDDPKPHHSSSSSSTNVSNVASKFLLGNDDKIKTKDLFDVMEDPPKSSEGKKSMPHDETFQYTEKYPMQESLAEELSPRIEKSVTGLGISHQQSDDLRLGQSAANMRQRSDDLMNFSYHSSTDLTHSNKTAESTHDDDIENIIQSIPNEAHRDRSELRKVVDAVTRYVGIKHIHLMESNKVLTDKNNDMMKKITQLNEDNKRQMDKIKGLEKQVYDLSMSRSPSPKGTTTNSENGWVHVQVADQTQQVAKMAEPNQKSAQSNNQEIDMLKEQNRQLKEANQRWSNEWEKLVAHYDGRISDLQKERDQLSKEVTELKISDEARQRDYEKMLMNSKKKAGDEENAKEEAFVQLTSVNNQLEAVRQQLLVSEDTVTALRREKQVLETEIAVLKHRSGNTGCVTGSSRSQSEMQTENDVLRQQLLVFQEDFDRERSDRAKAQSMKDEYKKQVETYKKRVRHVEQKVTTLEKQLKTTDECNKKLADDNSSLRQECQNLKLQLQREQEKNHNVMAYQQSPLIQSAGMQQQRPMIFGQPVQPRPQQYLVPTATYDQNPGLFGGGYHGYTGGQFTQQQSSPQIRNSSPYFPPSSAGRQQENRPGSWQCLQCTYKNCPERTVCELCGYIRSSNTNPNYRPVDNGTLHPRGGPNQPQHQQQFQQAVV